jgi:hypothetical protein
VRPEDLEPDLIILADQIVPTCLIGDIFLTDAGGLPPGTGD